MTRPVAVPAASAAFFMSAFLSACAATPAAEPTAVPMPVAHPAQAPQTRCYPRTDVLEGLARKYGEVQIAGGIASNGWLIEVLAAPDGSTFTIIATSPRGVSCQVSSGEDWRALDVPGPHLGQGT